MKVLVCPLDWGLGHATRSIPLIRALIANGHEVMVGATGGGLQLLRGEFPHLTVLDFPGASVSYARNPLFFLPHLLLQLPKLILGYFSEKKMLNQLVDTHKINVTVSDGRYGIHTKKCPSLFITHQIFIRVPGKFVGIQIFNWMVLQINLKMLKNFSEVWIPDYPGSQNLSGQLGHGKKLPANAIYIHPLSRFSAARHDAVTDLTYNLSAGLPSELPKIDYLALVSGPEPQRTLFAELLERQLKSLPGTKILVLGLPKKNPLQNLVIKNNSLNIFNHLPGATLQLLMNHAEFVVARSGYTTVMEMASLNLNAPVLVPTPGQSEQVYLAEHLEKSGTAMYVLQEKFDIQVAQEKISNYTGFTGFKAEEKSMLGVGTGGSDGEAIKDNFSLVEFIQKHRFFSLLFFITIFCGAISTHAQTQAKADPAVTKRLQFYQTRLKSYLNILQKADSLTPYFLAYRVNDTVYHSLQVNVGEVISDKSGGSRFLNVEARVGNSKFDNTHPMRENLDFTNWDGYQNVLLPSEPEGILAEKTLKTATDFAFRAAKDAYIKIRANVGVRPSESDTGLDFAHAPAVKYQDPPLPPMPARKSLDSLYRRVQKASRLFANQPHLYASQIDCNYRRVQKLFVNSDGTAIVHNETLGNIGIYVETKADDGMILWLTKDFFFKDIPLNFSEDSLNIAIKMLIGRLDSLRTAPVMETFVGPVILENTAAAVFTHEVFGHRIEGHRQKAVDEGQTFVSKINQSLTASFVTILDDPTQEYAGTVPLNGYYKFDDEGVRSARTLLLDKGIFKNFLFSRSVISPTCESNGHGRCVLGLPPTARMGNTILTASKTISFAALRDSLRAVLKKTGKPYGLLLHDISGGFTYTGRDLPQSFRVEPLYVSQVFADGRPDRLVRGVDAVGTPLVSLKQIIAAGNDPAVFNGYCGAESGWVPVSAVAPSLLLESMEFESRAKDQNLPPLLPPPGAKP